jgi:hypothetical protein
MALEDDEDNIPWTRDLPPRIVGMVWCREQGQTYAAIGRTYGLSKERIRQIVARCKRVQRNHEAQLTLLMRAPMLVNVLMSLKSQVDCDQQGCEDIGGKANGAH